MSLQCQLIDNDDPEFSEKIKQPGAMWFCPWYCGPTDDQAEQIPDFLSIHYLNDWKGKRAPIAVRCPNGGVWVPDQKSSNGTGWTVVGDAPNITCTPSIDIKTGAKGYHGFLQNGIFTDDLEGRTY